MTVATIQTILTVGLFVGGAMLSAKPLLAESASGYRELGLRYRQQGQFLEAIAALQKSVELEPENLSGRVTLGWTLHLAGQDQEAAQVLQQTFEHDPLYVPNLNALGIIYLVNDDLAAAAMTHIWAATLAPDNEIAHYNLSLAFQRLEQYPWAIDAAKKAAALEPSNPHPLVALAIAHWANGEKTVAQDVYRQAMAIDSRYRNSAFLNHLDEAGFSSDQIETSKQILSAM